MISKEYNVRNLVYDANFEVKLCKDLYWIPMNYLGIPKRCNEEYLRLKDCNLTYVQDIISCVYDAIQYLNAIGFSEKKDVTIRKEGDLNWEYHTSGIEAIKNTYGCCTSVASALKFLCQNVYEYIGFLFYVRPDTSNHVLCYIKQDGFFYIFDPSAHVYGSVQHTIKENGNIKNMHNKIFTSICFRTRNLSNFVRYYQRILLYNNHYFIFMDLFDKINSMEKMAIVNKNNKIYIYFPEYFNCNVLCKNNDIYSIETA